MRPHLSTLFINACLGCFLFVALSGVPDHGNDESNASDSQSTSITAPWATHFHAFFNSDIHFYCVALLENFQLWVGLLSSSAALGAFWVAARYDGGSILAEELGSVMSGSGRADAGGSAAGKDSTTASMPSSARQRHDDDDDDAPRLLDIVMPVFVAAGGSGVVGDATMGRDGDDLDALDVEWSEGNGPRDAVQHVMLPGYIAAGPLRHLLPSSHFMWRSPGSYKSGRAKREAQARQNAQRRRATWRRFVRRFPCSFMVPIVAVLVFVGSSEVYWWSVALVATIRQAQQQMAVFAAVSRSSSSVGTTPRGSAHSKGSDSCGVEEDNNSSESEEGIVVQSVAADTCDCALVASAVLFPFFLQLAEPERSFDYFWSVDELDPPLVLPRIAMPVMLLMQAVLVFLALVRYVAGGITTKGCAVILLSWLVALLGDQLSHQHQAAVVAVVPYACVAIYSSLSLCSRLQDWWSASREGLWKTDRLAASSRIRGLPLVIGVMACGASIAEVMIANYYAGVDESNGTANGTAEDVDRALSEDISECLGLRLLVGIPQVVGAVVGEWISPAAVAAARRR